MRNDTAILLDLPTASGYRRLRTGQVRSVGRMAFEVEFPGEMDVICGYETVVLYHESTRFLQQAVCVQSVEIDGAFTMLCLRRVGQPSSAQSRDCYRAPAYAKIVLCKLGAENDCRIVDVSLEGLGLVAKEVHAVHSTLPCVLSVAGREVRGRVTVMFADNRNGISTHYGLRAVEEEGSPFREALCELSLELQREQLARLAGVS